MFCFLGFKRAWFSRRILDDVIAARRRRQASPRRRMVHRSFFAKTSQSDVMVARRACKVVGF